MRHKEVQNCPPEIRILDSPPEPPGRHLACQLLAASQSLGLTIAQRLSYCVIVRCVTNVMFHAAREDERQVQLANGSTTPEPDEPRLLAKRLRPGGKIPCRIHETGHGINRQQMMRQGPRRQSEIATGPPPRFAGANPVRLPSRQILQAVDQKDRRDPTGRAATRSWSEQGCVRANACQQAQECSLPTGVIAEFVQCRFDRGINFDRVLFFLSSARVLVVRFA